MLHGGDAPTCGRCPKRRNLETLWIASPALERLPVEIVTLPRLRRLMLWSSNVREVPPELFEASHLRELRITKTRCGREQR